MLLGLRKIDGVISVNINFLTQKMDIEYAENNKEEIIEKVKKVIKRQEPDVTIEKI